MSEIDAWIVEKVALAIDGVPSMTFFVTRAARRAAVAEAAIAAYEEATGMRKAAELALYEMRHTVAPRNSFTDAVDALDAALNPPLT